MARRTARGECPACNHRHRLVKDGTFGTHYVPSPIDGRKVICHGYGDTPIEGTVRWYGYPPEFEVVEESSIIGPRAALALVFGVILFSFFFGVGVVIIR